MKFRLNLKLVTLPAMLLASSLIFNSCKDDDDKECCQGYTEKVTSPQAESLLERCHFLHKDSIEKWVNRYDAYKKELISRQGFNTGNQDSASKKAGEMQNDLDKLASDFILLGSASYNSCIIKKLICDPNSIGLRVLYGMGSDNKMHIIFVGINPDYSNLYVPGEDCCDNSLNKKLGAGLTGASGERGGAEYGQIP